jgi:hypothetical protein
VIHVFYLISALTAAASGVVLLALLVRLVGPIRRLAGTARTSRAGLADRSGLLAARIVALRVELDRRCRHHNTKTPRGTPTA